MVYGKTGSMLTLLFVISLLLSISSNQPLISFTSCENGPLISWKSKTLQWMRRSSVENCIHRGRNVLKRINPPF